MILDTVMWDDDVCLVEARQLLMNSLWEGFLGARGEDLGVSELSGIREDSGVHEVPSWDWGGFQHSRKYSGFVFGNEGGRG